MKYLHIMDNEKFTNGYIEFINKNFNIDEHYFVIWGGYSEDDMTLTKCKNIFKIPNNKLECKYYAINKLKEMLNKYSKIYLHSLFNKELIELLFLRPWLLKKCNWIVWGADIYNYENESDFQIKQKRYIAKNFGEITTLVKGDYEIAKKKYHVKGVYKKGIYVNYKSKKYLDDAMKYSEDENKEYINIQIGNSATETNKHIDIFNKLLRYKDENIKIFVPLSYGNKEYAEYICKVGYELFGNKFTPLLDFMDKDKYIEYLNKIDIAIFNNNRQQAMANISLLLYLGKKIYIRKDTTMWEHFDKVYDIKLYDIEDIAYIDTEEFKNQSNIEKLDNKNNISIIFDNEYGVEIWKEHFNK